MFPFSKTVASYLKSCLITELLTPVSDGCMLICCACCLLSSVVRLERLKTFQGSEGEGGQAHL